MQFLDKVIDIPVVVRRQVSMVQVVQKTVGREEEKTLRAEGGEVYLRECASGLQRGRGKFRGGHGCWER